MKLITVDTILVKQLSSFASDVFIDYYNDFIGHEQVQYMANMFLSEEAINKLISKGAIFKLVYENQSPVAFCEYVIDGNKVFLSKFYVEKTYRNKGIGRMMLNSCIDYAKQNNINLIYLTVNKNNKASIDKYLHIGFKVIDAVVNDIGNNYVMDDYIMQLQI